MQSMWVCVLRQFVALWAMVTMGTVPIKVLHNNNNNVLQATQVQEHLLSIQPAFKADLLAGVETFIVDTNEFEGNYDSRSAVSFWLKHDKLWVYVLMSVCPAVTKNFNIFFDAV